MQRASVFVLAFVVATSGIAAQAPDPPCDSALGLARLDFTLTNLDGRPVSLTTYKGKLLFINFWATWCAPCKVEIPAFIDLYHRYRASGLEVVGIAVDEPASTVRPYATTMNIAYPVLLETGHEAHEAFEVPGLPTTIIVNRDGSVCSRHIGFTRKATFESALERLLGVRR